ncbi:MAG: hypothetical protein IPJ19_18945 [Planctomycetes bacterium]|nr:hypothetical protein [Planctomycetota bacterium]
MNPARVHVRYEGRGRGMFDVERQGAVLAESEVFGGRRRRRTSRPAS